MEVPRSRSQVLEQLPRRSRARCCRAPSRRSRTRERAPRRTDRSHSGRCSRAARGGGRSRCQRCAPAHRCRAAARASRRGKNEDDPPAGPSALRRQEGLRRHRPHPHRRRRADARSSARASTPSSPLHRAHRDRSKAYTAEAPRAHGRPARGQRLPPADQGAHLPDRDRALARRRLWDLDGNEYVDVLQRLRHEPVRLAAGLRPRGRPRSSSTSATRSARSTRSPARSRDAVLRAHRRRPRRLLQHRLGGGDGRDAHRAHRHRPQHDRDLHRLLPRHLRRGDRARHAQAEAHPGRARHPAVDRRRTCWCSTTARPSRSRSCKRARTSSPPSWSSRCRAAAPTSSRASSCTSCARSPSSPAPC